MTAVLALFLDAYRELNSRKLFWITLGISFMVVVSYGSIGFDATGMSILFGATHVDSEYIKAGSPWAKALYLGIFSDFIVSIWLAWIATILALISTTTIFPDFVAGGSIDLVLSKPIARVKLFALKYIASLLFVLLQVAVFCVGVFLCVGLRLGEWRWMIFAAIPLVTVFFSYLFCVNVLVGVVTRSAIAALLLTMLFWISLWGVQSADGILTRFRIAAQVETERDQSTIDKLQAQLASLTDQDEASNDARRLRWQQELKDAQASKASSELIEQRLAPWHQPVRLLLATVPKTKDTIALLGRWFRGDSEYSIFAMIRGDMHPQNSSQKPSFRSNDVQNEMMRRIQKEEESKSPWFILGTSLGFEAVILGLACLVFIRRDY